LLLQHAVSPFLRISAPSGLFFESARKPLSLLLRSGLAAGRTAAGAIHIASHMEKKA